MVAIVSRTARAVVYVSSAAMMLLLVERLHWRGGPYWEVPETVFDHVDRGELPLSRQAIVMCEHVAPLLPRGASITVVAPALAPNWDATHYLTASGLLPHQYVRHPMFGEGEPRADFVITLGRPLDHYGYRLVRQWPEGWLYQRK